MFSLLNLRAVFASALFVLCLVPVSSFANNGDRIAVVDVQKLMGAAQAAKSLHEQLDVEQKKITDDRLSKEAELTAIEKNTFSDYKNMPKEEFISKKQEFDGKVLVAQSKLRDRKVALDRAFQASLTRIREEIIKASNIVAKDKGFSLVISKQYVIVSGPEKDITSDVLVILNKNLSEILLDVKESK